MTRLNAQKQVDENNKWFCLRGCPFSGKRCNGEKRKCHSFVPARLIDCIKEDPLECRGFTWVPAVCKLLLHTNLRRRAFHYDKNKVGDKYRDKVYFFLKDGERRKGDLRKFLNITEGQFKSLLDCIDLPLYQSENGRMVGWLR